MKQRDHYTAPTCEVITVRLQHIINASNRKTTNGSQDDIVHDDDDDMPGGGSNAPKWFDPLEEENSMGQFTPVIRNYQVFDDEEEELPS